jgi:2'-5' RNA ligase superfamily
VKHALLAPFPELATVAVLAPSPPDIGPALDGFDAFDVVFRETRRFSNAVYLAPEPAEPFVAMTNAVWASFPDWPPYGGEFLPDITPHLTIAWGAKLEEAEADLAARLPIRTRAREVVLFAQVEPARWVAQSRVPLRGA